MWWRHGTIYQVYPRSFQDSNGDGIGDLEGIRQRLPYLADLGIDAIWLSPVFASPMADFGYDVSDYRAIDPLFGTMADFDRLQAEVHRLGLRLILDFVPNHSSDQHEWFKESRSSRDNGKRDWYIWRDAAPGGGPPNNWLSHFGGSAWQWDEATGQYYYHAYLPQQPDLNWRNPQVRAAMRDVLRFWLDKGVDGFRVDVMWHLIKDAAFRDNPANPDYRPGRPEIERLRAVHSEDQPEVHEVVAELRATIDAFPDRVLIGEVYLPIERLMAYYGRDGYGAHLPFNFHLLETPWQAQAISDLIDRYEAALPANAWPNWVLSNHDRPRIAARVGEAQARIAAMLLLTLRGTPTIYYGDEIGIGEVRIDPGKAQDPWGVNEPGHNRDGARTPMQWSDAAQAGFSEAPPWLPLTDDWPARNVEAQARNPGSILSLYRALLALRKREPSLQTGSYRRLFVDSAVLAYERDGIGVFLNFTDKAERRDAPPGFSNGRILLAADGTRAGTEIEGKLELGPNDGLIVRRG